MAAAARPSVTLVSLGCSKNQVDSERMLSGLLQRGYRYEANSLDADLVVVNTCGFIGPAKDESIQTVVSYARLKDERPEVKLVVAGCLLERYGEQLRSELPEVDHWVDDMVGGGLAGQLERIADAELGPNRPPLQDLGPRSILLNEPGMAFLRISQGCDRKCSFCAIPGFKGRQVSVPRAELVEEARRLVDQGAHELVLVAQDLCRYGADIGDKGGLAGLLEALLEGTEAPWLRFLYAYPFSLPDPVVDLMAAEPRVLSYLDMPFQHADAGVLRAMRRGHTGERFLDYLQDFRERVPDLVTRTTMLVGHPGETPEAFEVARDFVERAAFEWMGVFEYSDEDGTHAETLEPKVDADEARRRARLLAETYESARKLDAFRLGQAQAALVLRKEDGLLVCRLASQAPEVDGLTFVPAPGDASVGPGALIQVVPTEAEDMDFHARLVGAEAGAGSAPRGAIEV